jgi:PBP1b-binding outer membrane lipoprotein LpoB
MVDKFIAILYIIYAALFFSGCVTTKPEQKLVGTLSVYRTERGFVVVSDQSGESMIVEFNIQRVLTKKRND